MRVTPTSAKKLKGSLNVTKEAKKKGGGEEVSFRVVNNIPAPPRYFGEIAIREWNDLLPSLKTAGTLENVDLPQLRMYCFNIQIVEECSQILADKGYAVTITNKGGHSYETESPAVATMNKALAVVNRIAAKFGFDPASRTKVAVPAKQKDEDPFESAIKNSSPLKIAK
jgi:P27 family predicted phage terminase small subunit